MNQKYSVSAFWYPWEGAYDYTYGTRFFVPFLVKLIVCWIKYFGVDVRIRRDRTEGVTRHDS